MYSEIPFYDRFQAAADDGFEFVEFWSWTDKDLDKVKEAAEKQKQEFRDAAARARESAAAKQASKEDESRPEGRSEERHDPFERPRRRRSGRQSL